MRARSPMNVTFILSMKELKGPIKQTQKPKKRLVELKRGRAGSCRRVMNRLNGRSMKCLRMQRMPHHSFQRYRHLMHPISNAADAICGVHAEMSPKHAEQSVENPACS